MTELNNVPEKTVPQVVENFILAGNVKITLTKQSDGNWTITGEQNRYSIVHVNL